MKRDMDLIRLILLDIEGETEVNLSSYGQEQITYHQKLLFDKGFIDGIDVSSTLGWEIIETKLTWEGHDFLDDARDENVWRESMKRVGKTIGTASLDVIKSVIAAVAAEFASGRIS